MALVMIPAAATVIIAATTTFPPPLREQSGVSFGEMVGEVFRRPSFFIWFAAMFLTAASELAPGQRSEEHTSELQSLMRISYAVFCLKKKNNDNTSNDTGNSQHTSRSQTKDYKRICRR